MAGPYLQLMGELRPAIEGAWGATVCWPWSPLGSQELACGLAEHLPYWQGFRVRTEQGMGCVGAPAPASH